MPSTSDIKLGERFKLLVSGGVGMGKTAGAATFPRPNFIDFGDGMATVASSWWQKAFGPKAVEYETFQDVISPNGTVTSHASFDNACRYFDAWMKKEGKWKALRTGIEQRTSIDDFDTWVIDEGTSLCEAAMNKAIVSRGGLAGNNKTQGLSARKTLGFTQYDQRDWGTARELTESFIKMVLSSGKNVIVLCHEKERTNDAGAVLDIVPLFIGQSVVAIPKDFDEVWFLKMIGGKRTLLTDRDGLRASRSRLLQIPNGTEFNYSAIMVAVAKQQGG